MIAGRTALRLAVIGAFATAAFAILARLPVSPSAGAQTAASSAAEADAAGLQNLVIVTKSGRHTFRVEVARTESERETGLMYRRSLPADRGMIFDFKTTQPVEMWMKNTYVPLDMFFMSKAGVVTHIARDAEPLSEAIIDSGGPVYSVLEVNAGTAAKINAQPGDKVEYSLFAR